MSEQARRDGLRGRTLNEDEGLLLEFAREGEVCIENQGVPIALDWVFAGDDRVVTRVDREVPALDGTARCGIARRVLEIRAGTASAVVLGDRMRD